MLERSAASCVKISAPVRLSTDANSRYRTEAQSNRQQSRRTGVADSSTISEIEDEIKYIFHEDFVDPACEQEILTDSPSVDSAQPTAPESVPGYLADIYKYRLLSRQDEFQLFRKMNFIKYQAENLRRSKAANENMRETRKTLDELIARTDELRNEIIQCNQRLAISVAKKFVRPAVRLDELMSEANVALMRAVECFDISRGYRFSTYASHSMYRHLMRVIRKHDRDYLKRELLETVPASGMEISNHVKPDIDETQVVAAILGHLTEDERSIVRLRFGLGKAARAHTFREIGELRGVSGERVRQILRQAIYRLRETLPRSDKSRWFVEQFV